MVIRLDSLSFSQIQSSLINYFNNQVEADRWRDFYESSTGRFFIRLLSAFGSFVSYLNVVNRRETYITYAENRASLIGIAQNLGYSVLRGKNEIVELTVVPNITGLIPAFTVVGNVKSLDLITVEDIQLNNATPVNVKLYIGKLSSEDVTIDTDKLKVFRFSSSNVSDYYRLKLNGNILPTSRNLRDLSNDKYVAISNPVGAVDISYIQEGSYKYLPNDTLTLEYIELNKVDYEQGELVFNFGSVINIVSNTPYLEPESNDSIRINAPLYHETQVLIRGRKDYLKEFKNLGYNLVSTNGIDFTPAIVELSYCRDNYTIINDGEKQDILNSLDNIRSFGIPLPRITPPNHVKLELNFNIKRQTNSLTELVDVTNDVNSLTAYYEKTLNPRIDLETLEHDMEDFSYVKRVRVSINTVNRANSTKYRIGDFIKSPLMTNKIYMARYICKSSGVSEPLWSYETDDLILDNGIIWRCMPKYSKNVKDWYPLRKYKVGDLVKSTSTVPEAQQYIFECIYIQRNSGATTPAFTPILKEFTEDGDLIWVCKNKINSDNLWQANTEYKLGDSIRFEDFSYEVVGFKGSSNTTLPLFKDTDNYSIISVDNSNPYIFVIDGNKTEHFLTNDTVRVQASSFNNGYYSVLGATFNGTNTEIQVEQQIPTNTVDGNIYMEDSLTSDGDILWQMIDEDEVLLRYNWNDYLKIKTNINLS